MHAAPCGLPDSSNSHPPDLFASKKIKILISLVLRDTTGHSPGGGAFKQVMSSTEQEARGRLGRR